MQCGNCARQIPDTAKVCGYCGQRVVVAPAEPPVPASAEADSSRPSDLPDTAPTEAATEPEAPAEPELAAEPEVAGEPRSEPPLVAAPPPLQPSSSSLEPAPTAPIIESASPPQLTPIEDTPIPETSPVDTAVPVTASSEAVAEAPLARGWRWWTGLLGAVLLFVSPWLNWVGGARHNKSRFVDEFECCEPAFGIDFLFSGGDIPVVGLFNAGQLVAAVGAIALLACFIRRVQFLGAIAGMLGLVILGFWYLRVFLREPYSFSFTFADNASAGAFVALAGCLLLLFLPLRARRKS